MLCRSFTGTLPRYGVDVTGGRLTIAGYDLTHADEKDWRPIRGRAVGYVPQSSLAGLNPVLTVETQLLEALHHRQPAAVQVARRAPRPAGCSTWSRSRAPTASSTSARTSSRAACASA